MHITARRFRAEYKRLRRDVLFGIVEQFEVVMHDFEHVQQLTLILVQPLNLRVETRFGIEHKARRLFDVIGIILFIRLFNLADFFEHGLVARVLHKSRKGFGLGVEIGTDKLGDKLRQTRVGLDKPTSVRNAVCNVGELVGKHLVKFAEYGVFDYFAVQRRHAVDLLRSYYAKVSHFYLIARNNAHCVYLAPVELMLFHSRVISAVDFAHNRINAREHVAERVFIPFFKRLRHNGVVGVIDGADSDVPRLVPRQVVFVHQQAHKLRNSESGVRVVGVDNRFIGQVFDVFIQTQVVFYNTL